MYVSECALYIIITRAAMCLNALYMVLLKWELVCVSMRFIWYYENERWYVFECAL